MLLWICLHYIPTHALNVCRCWVLEYHRRTVRIRAIMVRWHKNYSNEIFIHCDVSLTSNIVLQTTASFHANHVPFSGWIDNTTLWPNQAPPPHSLHVLAVHLRASVTRLRGTKLGSCGFVATKATWASTPTQELVHFRRSALSSISVPRYWLWPCLGRYQRLRNRDYRSTERRLCAAEYSSLQ